MRKFLAIFIKKLLTKRKRCATIKVQRDREKERSTKVDRVWKVLMDGFSLHRKIWEMEGHASAQFWRSDKFHSLPSCRTRNSAHFVHSGRFWARLIRTAILKIEYIGCMIPLYSIKKDYISLKDYLKKKSTLYLRSYVSLVSVWIKSN